MEVVKRILYIKAWQMNHILRHEGRSPTDRGGKLISDNPMKINEPMAHKGYFKNLLRVFNITFYKKGGVK